MQPIAQLADELFLDKVRRARATDPAEKLLDGARLFDFVCRIMSDGIRNQFPQADDEEVQRRLIEQLAIARRLESMP
jgi:hypothetical protein